MAYTTIDDASLYFRVKTYTGNSTNNTAITWDETHANMQPDWIWLKNRTASQEHWLADSVRGADKFLESNSTNAEADGTSGFDSFDANGFTVDNSARTNRNTMVGWGWKGGGSASSNSDGSITSSVSANTTAGFSIVSYTGSGSNATVGHGLGVAPAWYIVKQRNAGRSWNVYHKSLGATKYILLENTAGSGTDSTVWNDTGPTSTTFSVGTTNSTNASSGTFIAYCFAEKKGYSKFGVYTGNGNANGTFVYTGFRPAWIMSKRTDSSDGWRIRDAKRDIDNPAQHRLLANASDVEVIASSQDTDFLSNGFKIRNSDSGYNTSGATYIYMAFAESPFVNSNGVANNAR